MTCKFEFCDRTTIEARGLCQAHYQQTRRGETLHPLSKQKGIRTWKQNRLGYVYRGKESGVGNEFQHRVVMEQLLGRALLPNENVHHINGVKHDNRPENLELWLVSQPSGQRLEDLLAWAHELIETYERH